MSSYESKLLIVDDQKANRLTLEYILDNVDITAYHAASGEEALEMVKEHDFVAILMDVIMPGLDGYETIREIRKTKRFQKIPIVMVTALDTKEQYMKAYEAGAVDYVTKPVEPIVLINKVNQFVELSQQRNAALQAHIEQQKISSRMKGLLNSAGEGILGINLSGEITFANPKACQLLKVPHVKLIGRPIQSFVCDEPVNGVKPEPDPLSETGVISMLQHKDRFTRNKERWKNDEGELFYVEFSCEPIRDTRGKHDGGVVTFQNVSERKAIEDRLTRLANYDPLTNLANRAYFHDSLSKAMARSKRKESTLVLLFLDLDHFKNINDSLGHDTGDLLLKVVGSRLVDCIREGDVAARIGGDEFAIILHDIDSITAVVKIAEKIITRVHEPLELLGKTITTSTSIGIAVYDNFDLALDELIKAADIAMYVAKSDGRNTFQFFEPEMQKKAAEKNQIQITLSHAIQNNELSVSYQPKISIKEDKVIGLEALVRWKTSEGKQISPALFIPIAEESGQIHELGEWVFREVCRQIKIWQNQSGFTDLVVSINVSALQLKAGNFHRLVESVLDQYEIDPKHIEIELTETAVMSNAELTVRELHFLHALGLSISIDDFGTGYSSLNYLKRFPIDVLKIDQCFIKDIGHDRHDEDIIKIVVAIAHTMGIKVIAEGVETKEQLAFLSTIGCDLVQGYFFSKPLIASDASNMINSIGSTYLKHFEEFHQYMNENDILPLHVKMIH